MQDTGPNNQPSVSGQPVGDSTQSTGFAQTATSTSEPASTTSSAPPPVPEQTFDSPKGTNFFKVIGLILLAILVIGGFAYAGYYLGANKILLPMVAPSPTAEPTATPNPTSEWKTYSNTKYMYSIDYPSNLNTKVNPTGDVGKEAPVDAKFVSIYDPAKSSSNVFVTLEAFQKAPTYSSKEWTSIKTTINGVEANKYTSTKSGAEFVVYLVLLPKNEGYLEISVSDLADKKDVANQILATFKLLESTPSPSPKGQ